jgi:hypothetical protein
MDKKFNLDINLDDEQECDNFLLEHMQATDGVIAQRLGISNQEDGILLANRLKQYALRRQLAFEHRRKGQIEIALSYETQCDNIYREDINPICNCW